MTAEQFDTIVAEAREIAFGKDGVSGKGEAYNSKGQDLYKATGLVGRVADIWRKALRFVSAVHHGNFEPLREDALDLVVYSAMYVVVHDDHFKNNK